MTGDFDQQLRTIADRAATAARPAAPSEIRRRGTRRRRVRTAGVAVTVVALVGATFGLVEVVNRADQSDSVPAVVTPSPIVKTRPKPAQVPGPDRQITLTLGKRRLVQAMTNTSDDYQVGDVRAPLTTSDGSTRWRLVPLNPPGHRFQLQALNDAGRSRGCATALSELALRLQPCRSTDRNQSWVINPLVGGLQIEGLIGPTADDDLLASYYPEIDHVVVIPVDQGPVP